jgi:hypothetical protein
MSNLSLLRESTHTVKHIEKTSRNKSTNISLKKMEMDKQQLKKNEMDRQQFSEKTIEFFQYMKKEHNRISNICYFMEQVCSKMETIVIAMRPTGCIFDPLMKCPIKNVLPHIDGIFKIKQCLSLQKLIPEENHYGINKIIDLMQLYFINSHLLSDIDKINAKRYTDDMSEAWKSSIKIYLYDDSNQTLDVSSDDNYRPPLQTEPYFKNNNIIVIMKKTTELIKQGKNFTIMMGGLTHIFTLVDIYNEHYYLCDNIFNTYHH